MFKKSNCINVLYFNGISGSISQVKFQIDVHKIKTEKNSKHQHKFKNIYKIYFKNET